MNNETSNNYSYHLQHILYLHSYRSLWKDEMIDHWERLSNKECSIVRELAANNWDNITVEVLPFKLPIVNTTWNKGLVARNPRHFGLIEIHYEICGKKFKYTFKATECGYKYRNQKIKPWES